VPEDYMEEFKKSYPPPVTDTVASFKIGDKVVTSCATDPLSPLKKRPRESSLKHATVVGTNKDGKTVVLGWGWKGEKKPKAMEYATFVTDTSRVFRPS